MKRDMTKKSVTMENRLDEEGVILTPKEIVTAMLYLYDRENGNHRSMTEEETRIKNKLFGISDVEPRATDVVLPLLLNIIPQLDNRNINKLFDYAEMILTTQYKYIGDVVQ